MLACAASCLSGGTSMSTSAANTRATIIPALRYRDAKAAIGFLCDGLGFEKHAVYEGEDGTVMHAELSFGNGMIMLGSVAPTRSSARTCASPTRSAARRRRRPISSSRMPTRSIARAKAAKFDDRARHQGRGLWRARLHLPRSGGASLERRHLRSVEGGFVARSRARLSRETAASSSACARTQARLYSGRGRSFAQPRRVRRRPTAWR